MSVIATDRRWEPVLIRASAGTGKTFALSQRYIELLCAGESPDRILATTFTRKAAGEIQARVMGRLAAAAAGDAQSLAQLAIPQDKARAVLVRLTRSLHRLNICTLDSFFIRIARGYGPELGLTPGWSILDDDADRRLRSDAIRKVLNEEQPQAVVELMRMLNPGEHRRGVHEQIASIVDRLYSVYQAQPAAKAWDWLDPPARLNADELDTAIAAFDRLSWPDNKLIKKAAQDARQHIARGDWESFLCKGLAAKIAALEEMYQKWAIPTPTQRVYQKLITHARAVLLGRLADKTCATHRLLDAFDAHYWRIKLLAGRMSFADVTYGLARGAIYGRLEELYYRLDGRLDHLLLDEFQDTSLPQWAVLYPIAKEILSTAEDRSFFCVGDVKQAIYGWRGGEAAIFDWIEKRWPEIRIEPMNTTRRCRAEVVAAVNRVFSSLSGNEALGGHAKAVERWGTFTPHEAHAKDAGGYVRVLTSRRAEGSHTQSATTLADAAKVVQQIAGAAPGRSIGVLTRTNKAVARMILELRRLDPPIFASEEGGNPLIDTPAVCVIMSLLRLADHPGDTAAAFHVRRSPLGVIVGLTGGEPGVVLRVAAETRRALLDDGYGRTMERWVEALAAGGSCDARDLRRLGQLVDLAHHYNAQATPRPCDFVRLVEARHVDDPAAADVRVMTAHKAKGLEFDAVVLPDLDGPLSGNRGGELVLTACDDDDEKLGAPSRVARYANETLQRQDGDLREMCEQAVAAKVCEALNVLYVMMTRARYALHIVIAPPRGNERTMPATYAGIIRCALVGEEKIEPRKPIYKQGADDWHAKCPGSRAEPGRPEAPVAEVCLAPHGAGRLRGLPRQSPSRLEGREIDLDRMLRLDAGLGRKRGLSVHDKLRKVEWVEGAAPDPMLQPILARPDVRRILSRAAYPAPAGAAVRVLREEPFIVRDGDRLITGQFDRLVLVKRGAMVVAAEVIDFKTDSVDLASLDQCVEHYRPQIELYRRAASHLYKLDQTQVTAKLVFLSSGAVREI